RRFLADQIEPTCITREGAAAFLLKQGYPWPADWGACPSVSAIPIEPASIKQAATVEAVVKELEPATDSDTRKADQIWKEDAEKSYERRIIDGQRPTAAADEAWRKEKGYSRPLIRELRAKFLTPMAEKGGRPKKRRKT